MTRRFPKRASLAIFSAVLFLATNLAAIGEPPVKVVDAELDHHQGSWLATSFVYDGVETSKDIVETITREVEGDHVVWKRDGKNFAGTKVVLDPSKEPKTIDVTPDGGPNRDKVVAGIYKLDGDRLTICMAGRDGERPKTFEAAKGSGRTLMKFRRTNHRDSAR